MKISIIASFCVILLLLASCSQSEDKNTVMPLYYKTSRHQGINYFRTPIKLTLYNGELIFENTCDIPIHLSIYNRSDGSKLQYEVTLLPFEHVAYCNLCRSDKYELGISVKSDPGSKDVSLLVYNSYVSFYSKSTLEKRNIVSSDEKWYDNVIDVLGLILIL